MIIGKTARCLKSLKLKQLGVYNENFADTKRFQNLLKTQPSESCQQQVQCRNNTEENKATKDASVVVKTSSFGFVVGPAVVKMFQYPISCVSET